MWGIISWIIIIAGFAGLIVAGLWYYKTQMGGTDGAPGGLFGARAEKRLAVVEQSNVDGRRKLVLIRRDDVEHLIMTGGPVDVVIETNIVDEQDIIPPRQSKLRSRLDDNNSGSGSGSGADHGGLSRIPPTL